MQGHYRFLSPPQYLIFRILETGHITSRQKYGNVASEEREIQYGVENRESCTAENREVEKRQAKRYRLWSLG